LSYLLDACALIAYLSEEKGKGYEAVNELLNRAKDGEIRAVEQAENLSVLWIC
jgi:PIN domain nuclease of toxin-antitoxin system